MVPILLRTTAMLILILPALASAKPDAYGDGFRDGCHSGRQAAGSWFDRFRKDPVRFNEDTYYAQGWSDGFRQCESQMEAQQRMTRQAMQWNAMQDHHKDKFDKIARDAIRGVDGASLKGLEKK